MSAHSDFMVHFMNNVEPPTLIFALIFGSCKKPMGRALPKSGVCSALASCTVVVFWYLIMPWLYPTHFELGKVVWGKNSQPSKKERKKVQVIGRCFIVLLGRGVENKRKK